MEPQSETVWRQASKYGVPRIGFVNKMDRAGANFLGCVGQIRERLNANPVPIQLPLGREDSYLGIIDLVKMNANVYSDKKDKGEIYEEVDIPEEFMEEALEYRELMSASARIFTAVFLGGVEEWPPAALAAISKFIIPFSATLIGATNFSTPGKKPLFTNEPSSKDQWS